MGKVVTISWPSHGKDLATRLWKLLQEEFKTDFEVSINGCYIKAHHLILAAFCPAIKESDSRTVIMGEDPLMTKEDVEELFKFLYRGHLDVDEDRLPSLKEAAKRLGFKTLADIIQKFLSFKKQDVKSRNEANIVDRNLTESFNKHKLDDSTCNNSNYFDLASLLQENVKDDSDSSADMHDEVKLEDKEGVNEGLCSGAFNPETRQYVCRICNKGFPRSTDLSVHLHVHEKVEVKYKCKHCDYKTNSRQVFASHMISRHQMDLDGNHQPKNLKCPQCAFMCSANFQLKNHMYLVHSFKRKVCESCGYRCQSDSVLEKHKKLVHSNAKPLMCETCGYRAKIPDHLRRHMRVHYGTPRISCDVCGTSVSVNYLSQHKKIHSTTPKPHGCQLCGFTSWKNWNLKFHLKTVHKIDVDSSNSNELNEYKNMMN